MFRAPGTGETYTRCEAADAGPDVARVASARATKEVGRARRMDQRTMVMVLRGKRFAACWTWAPEAPLPVPEVRAFPECDASLPQPRPEGLPRSNRFRRGFRVSCR